MKHPIHAALIVVVISVLTAPAWGQPGGQPLKTKCEILCVNYKQALETEAAEVAGVRPQPRYLPRDSKEVVLRLRLLSPHPELDRPLPPIDDELRVYVNGNQVWEVLYGSVQNRPGTEFTLTADMLPLRNANVLLRWRTTVGPDAHFFVEVGGTLVCPNEGWCNQVYREGLSFGPKHMILGLFPSFMIRNEIDLVNGWVWRSTVNPYAAECKDHKCQ